ncbi:hypothetical protein B0H14DRAFT_2831952, partial [Mycena olivaceomarginata]
MEAVEAVEAPAEMAGGGVAETVEATSSDTITAPPGASSASTCTGTPGLRSSPGCTSGHGDFAGWCPTTQPVDKCFVPLSAYAWRAEEVREELQRARGIEVQRVVFTSNKTNAMLWEEVVVYGWHRVDHSTTVETHSRWHPVLINTAIQSGGTPEGGWRQGGGGRRAE